MTTFANLLNFIRNHEVGTLITRKSIMKSVKGGETTLDQYRRHFTAAGYLSHIGRGEYILIRKPTLDLYARKIRKEAYPWWREWNEYKYP